MSCTNQSGQRSRISRLIIGFNNWRRNRKDFKVRPENILLLLPRCLQFSECVQNITQDISNCKRCGQCKVKNLVEIAEELGVMPFVATGGRIAISKVLESGVQAVVALACEVELKAGILASPKPVIAVVNLRPNGPCLNTDVDINEIRRAIRRLTGIQ